MSSPAPARTLDQRLRALRQANEIRIGRAQLKQELATGRVRIEEILAQPPEFAKTAKVYDLLLALPKIGPAKGRALARSLSHRAVENRPRSHRAPARRADQTPPPLSARARGS